MRQPVSGHTRPGGPGRPFHLLAQVPPLDAAAPAPASATPLSVATRAQLQTILTLCQHLVSASSGELCLHREGGWEPLVASDPPAKQNEWRDVATADPATADRQGAGYHVVRLATSPPLALVLRVESPVTPAMARLLREALALALPVLGMDERLRRDEQARQRVLHVQEELAHDLRTPLTAISGFAQLLQRPGKLDEARRRDFAAIAVTESQQATAIIDHLVARLQAEAEALGGTAAPRDASAPTSRPTQ